MGWEDGCFITLGLAFLLVGTSFRLGHFREYYWMQPFSYYRTAGYGLIPFGIALLLLAAIPLFYGTIWLAALRTLVIFLGLLGIFMWIFKPKFAKPDWINWLEDNHFDILPDLRQEMWHRKGNRKDIKEIIENQEKLEAWIAEFRCRRTE